jgi:hypothetical protein
MEGAKKMKMVYTSLNISDLYIVKGILENNGIECTVKKENLTGLAGKIPMAECFAELWANNDENFDRAQEIINSYLQPKNTEESSGKWKCERCGEELENQFSSCWKCGTEKSP